MRFWLRRKCWKVKVVKVCLHIESKKILRGHEKHPFVTAGRPLNKRLTTTSTHVSQGNQLGGGRIRRKLRNDEIHNVPFWFGPCSPCDIIIYYLGRSARGEWQLQGYGGQEGRTLVRMEPAQRGLKKAMASLPSRRKTLCYHPRVSRQWYQQLGEEDQHDQSLKKDELQADKTEFFRLGPWWSSNCETVPCYQESSRICPTNCRGRHWQREETE